MTKQEAITALQELKSALAKVASINKSIISIFYDLNRYSGQSPNLTVLCLDLSELQHLLESEIKIEPFKGTYSDTKASMKVEDIEFFHFPEHDKVSA